MPTPRKSYALHVLSGNPSNLSRTELAKRAASETTSETTVQAGRPKPPKTLTALEAECWKKAAKDMRARGTLSRGDGENLELYAVLKARWIVARRDVEENGQKIEETRHAKDGTEYTVIVTNPSLKICNDCEQRLHAVLKVLGLTPMDRTRVKQAKGSGATKRELAPDSLGAMFPNMFKKGEKVC
jgi:P27 family predicted phage terminase small subunit